MEKAQVVLAYNKVLTERSRRVFGRSAVKAAYISTYSYSHNTAAEIRERLKDSKERIAQGNPEARDRDKTLNYDAENIVIEFSTGRKVLFTNSEWASMELLDDVEVRELP